MKRIIAFILAAVMALSFCACGKKDVDPETYVGEGLLATFRSLADSNQYFYNEVFVLGHLKVSETTTVTEGKKTYALVTDPRYSNYADLEAALKAVYTDKCAEEILKKYPIYKDIDGSLYLDMSKAPEGKESERWVMNFDKDPVVSRAKEKEYELDYYFTKGSRTKKKDFDFVRIGNGVRDSYRLEDFVDVN